MQVTYEMRKVLVSMVIPRDVDALAEIAHLDRTPGADFVIHLLAAAPVPTPDAWAPTSFARWPRIAAGTCPTSLAARSSQRGGACWTGATISRAQSTSSLISVPKFVARVFALFALYFCRLFSVASKDAVHTRR